MTQIPTLERLTTQYHPVEDRIRLSGDVGGEVVVLWLTKRLIDMLLPHLAKSVSGEGDRTSELINTVQQAKVRQAHQASVSAGNQKPVLAEAPSEEWLVVSVDVKQNEGDFTLVFKDKEKESRHQCKLDLKGNNLRIWLDVLLKNCQKAGWPTDKWPEWMKEEGEQPREQTPSVVH